MISITKFLLLASVVAQGALSAPTNAQPSTSTVHFIHNYTPQKMVEIGTCDIADPSKLKLPECIGGLIHNRGKNLSCTVLSPLNDHDPKYKAVCEDNGGKFSGYELLNKEGKPYTAEVLLLDSRKEGSNEYSKCTNVTFNKIYPYFGPKAPTGELVVVCKRLVDYGNSQYGCVRKHINTTPRVKWAKSHFEESCQLAGGQIVQADDNSKNKKP